eukprot:793645_1
MDAQFLSISYSITRKMNQMTQKKKESANDDKKGDEAKQTQKKENKNDANKDENDGLTSRVKFAVSKPLKDLLFDGMELYTNYRKRIQIHLLNLRISETKSKFNRQVEELFKLKKK